MAYTDEMKKQGGWLFRWRGFLPVLMAPLFVVGLWRFSYPMGSHLLDRLWEMFCLAISILGIAIRIYTVGYVPEGTSGRTTSSIKATELNTTGMYSIVRNPLYLGNLLMWAGIALFPRSVLLVIVCVLAFFLYYERIIVAEEAFLLEKFGATFAQWAEKTPAMMPKIRLWRKPTRPFSWRTVLSREYPGFLTIAACFTAAEILSDWFCEGVWKLDWLWMTILCIVFLVFVVLRTLKKLGITKPRRNPPIQTKTS